MELAYKDNIMGWKKVNYVSPDATPGRENINSWDGMCELKQGNLIMANKTESWNRMWNKGFSERVLSERQEDRKEQSHVGPDAKDVELCQGSFVRKENVFTIKILNYSLL